MSQLQQSFDQLKLQYQVKTSAKDIKMKQLHFSLDQLKDNPKVKDFIKQTLELNSLSQGNKKHYVKSFLSSIQCVRKVIH